METMKSKKQMMRERDAALKEKVKFTQTLAYLIVQANGRLVLNKDNVVPLDGYRIHVEENDQELILRLMDEDLTFLGEGSPSPDIPCILNLDSPSYPPELEEYVQCATRGCKSCLAEVAKRLAEAGNMSPSSKEASSDPVG
jgi:hypothetical protein